MRKQKVSMIANVGLFFFHSNYKKSGGLVNGFLFFMGLILLASCGQVGDITGGDIDKIAPRPILKKTNPPFGSTQLYPQKIIIPFDEFIELNKPTENILVSPQDVRLNYVIKNKSLVLNVKEGEWQPNTTYTIYLNRAVKDITEKNDSIMAYVFSTGNFLDSMQTVVKILDAYSHQPVKDITVGLYQKPLVEDTTKMYPRYYATTDNDGMAIFSNIKDTVFYLYAFNDENRNNRLDENEERAALDVPITLFVEDTVERIAPVIYLMPSEEKNLKIRSNEVEPTASWCIGFNRPLEENEAFEFLDLPHRMVWSKARDSVTAFYQTVEKSGTFRGVLHHQSLSDTIAKKYFFKEKPKLSIQNNLKDSKLDFQDTLTLTLNEPLKEMDTSLFQLQEIIKKDSIIEEVKFTVLPLTANSFGVLFKKETENKLIFKAKTQSISGINYTLSDSLYWEFSLQKEKETGSLLIEFDTLPPYGILYVSNAKNKSEWAIPFNGIEKMSHQLHYLLPGEYSFRYLIDENKDGRWTTGSIFEHKPAEKIIWIDTKTTVRGNWEVKTQLSLEKNPPPTEKIKETDD